MLVTDKDSHLTADSATTWLNGIGCIYLFTVHRHPCSYDQVENFVRTLKAAINSIAVSIFDELERRIYTFLLQYRNADTIVRSDGHQSHFRMSSNNI